MKRCGAIRWRTLAAVLPFMALQGAFSLSMAHGGEPKDLRDISVGMAVSSLPDKGYVNFVCVADPARKLSGWEQWRQCPAGADGARTIRFDYDRSTSREGTIVAGHPAILTLSVDDAGSVAGLQIVTDPKARLYLKKKAFLLGMQAKSRYGSDGWNCTETQPGAQEQPVGGVYVNERCTKSVTGRDLVVERHLYRRADQDEKHFIDETRITIRRARS